MSLWTYGPPPESREEMVERVLPTITAAIEKGYTLGKADAVKDRDAELSRWRDPAQPDWVVYPLKDGAVKALNEVTLSVVFRRFPEHSESYQKTPGNRAILAWIEAGKPLSPTCDKCGGVLGRIGECRCVVESIRARLQARRSEVIPDSGLPSSAAAVFDDCAIAPVLADPPIVEDSPLPASADLDHTYCVRCCPDSASHVHSYCGETAGDGDTIDSGAPANCPACLSFDGCPVCGHGAAL